MCLAHLFKYIEIDSKLPFLTKRDKDGYVVVDTAGFGQALLQCEAYQTKKNPNYIIQISYSLSQVLTHCAKKYLIVLLDCFCPTSWHAKFTCRLKKDILKLNKPIYYMSSFT